MIIYQYRCATHGLAVSQFPIGTAPATLDCKSCSAPAKRVFSAPTLTSRCAASAKAIEMHEKSRSSPGLVVRSTEYPAHGSGRRVDRATPRLPRP